MYYIRLNLNKNASDTEIAYKEKLVLNVAALGHISSGAVGLFIYYYRRAVV